MHVLYVQYLQLQYCTELVFINLMFYAVLYIQEF